MFDDVPFTKARSSGDPSTDPNIVVERRLVAAVTYPCDMYHDGRLVRVQTIAPVTSADKSGIPQDWSGAFTFAPLPDLLGDGDMYAVDLRASANIDRSYLQPEHRIRCLSEYGWAIFRQRLALCSTRTTGSVEALTQVGRPTWAETELWERWNEAGGANDGFQAWLDEPDADLGGFTRRKLLERRQVDVVRSALETKLACR